MNMLDIFPFSASFVRLVLSCLRSTNIRSYCATVQNARLTLSDFDTDEETGFFPRQPLERLPIMYELWERALAKAGETLSLGEDESDAAVDKWAAGETWRSDIISWPVLDTYALHGNTRQLQRAHYVLAWLVQFFVHSIPEPNAGEGPIYIPKSLAIPLVDVSRALRMAPILTYADTVLWNWELVNPRLPMSMENVRCANTFSGTDDERNFFLGAAKTDFRGVELLRIIHDFCSLPNITSFTSISKISRDLVRMAGIIDDISGIMQGIRPTCDPHTFYWDIRPWFEGSGSKKREWVYEGVDNPEELDLSGPSNGQSTVMHLIDVFLDVDHRLREKRSPAPTEANRQADVGFMERMRRYMPGKHREYLEYVASRPLTVRQLALSTPALKEPYNTAVSAMKRLRDAHMRIACLYIVTMSKTTPDARSGCPVAAMMARLEKKRAAGEGPATGTGGNTLSSLLKAGRDATRRTLLE